VEGSAGGIRRVGKRKKVGEGGDKDERGGREGKEAGCVVWYKTLKKDKGSRLTSCYIHLKLLRNSQSF
jgi:hypothetical protein